MKVGFKRIAKQSPIYPLYRTLHNRTMRSVIYQLIKARGTFQQKRGYLIDLREFRRQAKSSELSFPFGKPYPIVDQKCSQSGEAWGHYFHQDLLVARRVFLNNPEIHVDIGSRLAGFVAHVASFREIEVFDIRDLPRRIPNVRFHRIDLMNLDKAYYEYCDSISSLHTIEHFGLGRYGDPINFDGHINGLNNIYKMLKGRGKFYFSVPIGPQRVEYNAHRVFALGYIMELLGEHYVIDSFSYVSDDGNLHEDVALESELIEHSCGCEYGCGIFELTKKS